MSDTTTRLCGPDCPTPEVPHSPPEPDWIGDMPVMHGESDHKTSCPGITNAYCLCGHPDYWTCPIYLTDGGIGGWTITGREADTDE